MSANGNYTPPAPPYEGPRQIIAIRATAVRNHGDNIFTIEIPVNELSSTQSQMLESLFPHTMEQAHELLQKEALLASLANPREVTEADKKRKEASGYSKAAEAVMPEPVKRAPNK